MRPSNRTTILDAAVRVVQREGVTAVTFDSVAVEAGLTRGGLMYHFGSREDLLQAIHEHLAQQWEAAMIAAVGKNPEDATPAERLAAYARVCIQSSTRAELVFLLDAATNTDQVAPWNAVLDRWAPPATDAADDPAALARFIARLAADGLWLHESLTDQPLGPKLRERVADQIVRLITQPENTAS